MLNDAYSSHMMSCRSLEKNLSIYSQVNLENPEVYFSIHDALLEMCDKSGLKNTTKYIIKKSIDTYILNYPSTSPSGISFAAMNFFRMAVKMNQDPSCYDELTLELCMQKVGGEFTKEDFIRFEWEFYNKQGFEMNFTTPYDYLGLYESVFPMTGKMKERVKFLLDFSFTIPELMLNTAEELFFGCMLVGYEENILQASWILRQTHSEEKSKQVAAIILFIYEQEANATQTAQFQ